MELPFLYYNCDDPIRVIRSRSLKPSSVFTGVSLSDWLELGSHGPFKLTFKPSPWFAQLVKVHYWQPVGSRLQRNSDPDDCAKRQKRYQNVDGAIVSEDEYTRQYNLAEAEFEAKVGSSAGFHRVWKTSFMFKDEREWYSPTEVKFAVDDIAAITFMTNSPIIKPRICREARRVLSKQFPTIYEERQVNDPYLRPRKVD
jgi:hypothetical protein